MTGGSIRTVADRLRQAGFVAADEQAAALIERAGGDAVLLEELTVRRLTGEPLAWITGAIEFLGAPVRVDPGVYVPRWQTEQLAQRALARLPADGVAIDVCTGTGAVAMALQARRPAARVVGTDLSEIAVACARANGVDAVVGDLFDAVPATLAATVDVVVGVVPYVPSESLHLLQRDTLGFEPALAIDGGPGGVGILRRVVAGATEFLRPGGALLLELGGDQADVLVNDLMVHGYDFVDVLVDDDGDVRGIEATFAIS
jgi:release factor glutamine methyltransferase